MYPSRIELSNLSYLKHKDVVFRLFPSTIMYKGPYFNRPTSITEVS